MKNVIVIGATHHNTLSMVRCLGVAGYDIKLFIYGDKDSYIQYSKYVKEYINVDTCKDVFAILLRDASNKQEKQTVITCGDDVSHLFDEYFEELKDTFNFFNAGEKGRLTLYMDKQVQVNLARECGFTVPKSIVKDAGAETIQFDTYPCICKPICSISGSKSQICICNNQNSLNKCMKGWGEQSRVQIQEFIKKEYEMVVVGLCINQEVIIPGFIKKLRDRMGGTTYATIYPITQLPQKVIESVKRFVKEVHYEGLFGMELIYSKGNYYFVETNLRNDATTYAFSVAGVNLPLAYVMAKNGEDYHVETLKNIRQINTMVELVDVTNVMKLQIGLIRWLIERKGCESLYFYNKEDMIPYKIAKRQFVMRYVNKILKKLHIS